MSGSKTSSGNFFEDFRLGQELVHATPRTVTTGDAALYTALYGSRFPLTSAASFARATGLPDTPLDDLLVFHVVFGKTVPDVSLNAVANLGYAECRFLKPVYPGATLSTRSEVIGLKENSNGKTGVVYVRSIGRDETGEAVLDYVRWVMVRKRDEATPAPAPVVPTLKAALDPSELVMPAGFEPDGYDTLLAGSPHLFDDYSVGERIDHVDGMTIEEAEHMLATRLYQNTSRVHFNQHVEGKGRFGRRLIYGGHIISLARALSFNGLGNGCFVVAINGGSHTSPTFAGDTIYAWSEILDKAEAGPKAGYLRIRTCAAKNHACTDYPDRDADGKRRAEIVLELDYWVMMPRVQR
ncbi:MaoC family dehydratase [Oceanibacterium hippocampi]|uniref:MaoC like domain protein n=1 Tax=Oceanibacterium hippocampi TaxID=745714 RepID=A0A1Y5RGG0_9PROT|nr:MaoC family dehydratase [Oceanibacterium hippocampi]SLN14088.1 MaoC like domain protein [Oceanibacterium hippocampi]